MDRLGARWGLVIYDECHHLPGRVVSPGGRERHRALPPRAHGDAGAQRRPRGPAQRPRRPGGLQPRHQGARGRPPRRVLRRDGDGRPHPRGGRGLRRAPRDLPRLRLLRGHPHGRARRLGALPPGERAQPRGAPGAALAYQQQKRIALASQGKLEVLEGLLRQHSRDRTLIFTNDNDTVYAIARRFLIPAITHQTDVKERREVLERFNSGSLPRARHLAGAQRGREHPRGQRGHRAERAPPRVREHVQRLGRILRRQEGKRRSVRGDHPRHRGGAPVATAAGARCLPLTSSARGW
jgi:hypothetical protein